MSDVVLLVQLYVFMCTRVVLNVKVLKHTVDHSNDKILATWYYHLVWESHSRLVNRHLTKTMNDKAIVCSPLHHLQP